MSNVPVLRFLEFNNDYRNYLFENIFLFSTGKNIKQNEASPEYKTPCVRYGELYHLYDEVITKIVNKTNLNESELTFSEGNEILLPSAGEDALDIGSASALVLANIAIGRTINILRPREEEAYSPIYVSYYINQKLRKKISTLARGASISNVYNSDLKKLTINLPDLKEQKKIANFLSAVDSKIEQLGKKKALLEQYKKGVASTLLSTSMPFDKAQGKPIDSAQGKPIDSAQGKRFKQDNGVDYPDWEVKRLGDVFNISAGGDVGKLNFSKTETKELKIPVFANALRKAGLYGYTDIPKVTKEAVTITGRGDVGYAEARLVPFVAVVRLLVLLPKEKASVIFFKHAINSLKIFVESTGVPQLTAPQISEYKLSIPCYSEQ